MNPSLRLIAPLAFASILCLASACSPDSEVAGGPTVNSNPTDTKTDIAEQDSTPVDSNVVDAVVPVDVVDPDDSLIGPVDVPDPTDCQVDQDCPQPPNLSTCQKVACVDNKCLVSQQEDGVSCGDAGPCVTEGKCVAGACEGAVNACDDNDPCTTDACDPASGDCSHVKIDGCGKPGCNSDQDCDDGNVCTQDMCDAGTGVCANLTIPGCADPCAGKNCDDGDKCTTDSCVVSADGGAACKNVKIPNCGIIPDGTGQTT